MAFSPRGGAVISFTVEGAQTAQRQIETIGDSFDRLSTVASTGIKALAAGYAAWNIGGYVKDATLLAARYETLAIVMHTAGVNAGYSGAQMDTYAAGLEKSGISMMKAREAMISMTTANLDNNKSLELGRMAQNLAVVANKSSSETLTDLITNIQQADTEGLKHMGIILNQDEALQKYAASHNTVTKALTQTQKAEAIQQAVMLQGAKYAGIYEQAMGTAGKALGSLDRYFENIKVRLGTPLLEGFAQGVFGVTDGVKQLNKGLEELEKSGAMEGMAKSIGSSVGAVISVIKDVIGVTGQIGGAVISAGRAAAKFFDDYLGGMATVKAATVGFALLLSGFMVEQAVIGFNALSAAAWGAVLKVGAAFLAMSRSVVTFFAVLNGAAAAFGWGTALAIGARTLVAGVGAAIASIPGAVGAAVVVAGLGVGYIFAKAFGDQIEKYMPKFIDDAVNKGMAWIVSKTSSLPEVSEAVDRGKPEDATMAAANKAEKDRKELLMREMNNSVVAAETQVSTVSATNTRLKALNELRDQQLKQSFDQRIITQADYLQKKEKMDVAEAQGQVNQISAQKAQLGTYMAAFKAGAPLGQGRDPAADANEMIKLTAEETAAQTKLAAVKQNYAYLIAGAMVEGYTKEFGSVSSLAEAQADLARKSKQAYDVAGKTAEQQEIFSAQRMQEIGREISAEREKQRLSGTATKEYLDATKAMADALEQMGAARIKALSKNVSADFINDTKAMRDDTAALYNEMKSTFIGTEEERVRAAAQASIRLASIKLADAKLAIAGTNDSDAQKAEALRKLTSAYNDYTAAVNANADVKAMQASAGFQELAATLNAAFDPARVENFGQTLAGAFGTAGDALGSLLDTFDQFDKQQRASDLARLTAAKRFKEQPEELAAANAALTAKQNKDSLGYYANMAGAAKQFFKENTTGYKLMEGAEKAFRLMELASQMESLYTHLFVTTAKAAGTVTGQAVETGAVITGEAARNAAKVPGVFMSFMSALGPWGMAAAGVAIAAVLGGAFSGDGSVDIAKDRQATQGTGSILGDKDAKSESIKKSLDLIEKNTYQDLTISSSMLSVLQSINDGIGGLSNILYRTDGFSTKVADTGSSGFFPKLGNSIFGGKTSTIDTGIAANAASFSAILAGGLNIDRYSDTKTDGGWFHGDKYKTQSASLGAEVNDQFTKIFADMGKAITQEAAMLGLSGDVFTTKLNSFVVDLGKISTKDMKPEEVQAALQNVLSKVGDDFAKFAVDGLQQFQNAGEGAFETLARIATEYQTVDVVFASFGKTFDQVGLQSVAARDRLVELAGGLDKFSSQGEYFLKNFFSEQEQAAALKARVQPVLDQYGLQASGEGAMRALRDFIVCLDTTTEAGAQAYTTLIQAAPAIKQIADAEQHLYDERKDLQDKFDELTMTSAQLHEKERAAVDASNLALYDRVAALQAEKDAVQTARDAATTALGNVDNAFSVLQRVTKTTTDTLTARITAEKALSDAVKSTLASMKVQGAEMADRLSAQAQVKAALAIAKASGVLPDAAALQKPFSVLSQDAASMFSNQQDYLRDFYSTQRDIASLGDMADSSLSVDQLQLDSLNNMLKAAQQQIDILKGIDTSNLTIAQALSGFDLAVGSAKANPVVGATSGIVDLYQSLLGRAPDQAGLQFWQDSAAKGVSLDVMRQKFMASDEYKAHQRELGIPGFAGGGDHAGGWRLVGESGPELEATGPARIFNASQTSSLMSRLVSPAANADALAAAVDRLNATVERQQAVIESQGATLEETRRQAKRLADNFERVTRGGDKMVTTTES
jgi:hypothetical protein